MNSIVYLWFAFIMSLFAIAQAFLEDINMVIFNSVMTIFNLIMASQETKSE